MDQYWLTIIIVLLIAGIIFDGLRRMRKARRDSIKMALKPAKQDESNAELEAQDNYGSEFPNGGARVSERQIDPDRIKQARNKYNFGTDMSAWRDKVAEKIAEHTGIHKTGGEASAVVNKEKNDRIAPRIEPSFADADPLLDDLSSDQTVEIDESVEADIEILAQNRELEREAAEAEELRVQSKVDTSTVKTRQAVTEPVQASLNLEDSVPMLMDSVEGESVEDGLDDAPLEAASSEHMENKEESVSAFDSEPEEIVPVGSPVQEEEKGSLGSHSANKPRYESKYTDHAEHQVEAPQEVLVIHVRSADNEYFYGNDLLELVLDNGLRFGAMDIFHRHAGEDGEGPILFSMANMVKPGVFDLHTFEDFSTVGVSFFLGLPTETGADMAAFDAMLATAQSIADKLQGELKDENRSVLTKQTIEHYRERIRDFARRQQLEKNKP